MLCNTMYQMVQIVNDVSSWVRLHEVLVATRNTVDVRVEDA